MAVHVDTAGHDDQPPGIDHTCRPDLGVGGRRDDLAAGDPEVAHLAVDAIGRVVDRSAGDLEIVGASW